MAYFLAVDVGGTKTDYVLADESRELARVRTGTIKRMRIDAQTAAANLSEALTTLTAQTNVSMQSISCTCIGTAGETVALVTDWLRGAFAGSVGGDLILIGDVEIALDAAFRGGPGVLAMAGTGSNVAARGSNGRLITTGGWGPALADQGSGHRIGLEGLRAGFLALDEEKPSMLLEAVMRFWELKSIDELVGFGNSIPAPDFSRLTEVVIRCAADGDQVAAGVLRKEGEDLGWLVRLALRRVQSPTGDSSAEVPPLAFTGSILENVEPVRSALLAAVRQEFSTIRALPGVVDPITGALWRARLGAHYETTRS